jgi:transposase-like protein
MGKKRRQYNAEFKFRVALAAVREVQTASELSSRYDVHATVIRKWKNQLLQDGPQVFATANGQAQREQDGKEAELYEQIGRLKMELEWMKKKVAQFD